MASREARKGNRFERQIVKLLTDLGLDAHRSRGSDGRSLLLDQKVDVVFRKQKFEAWNTIQCKNDEAVPEYIFFVNPTRIIESGTGERFIALPEDFALEWIARWQGPTDESCLFELDPDFTRKTIRKDLKPDADAGILIQCVTRNRRPSIWIVREDTLSTLQVIMTHE